jgi:hypothetical protein
VSLAKIIVPKLVKEMACSYGARRFIFMLAISHLRSSHIGHLDIIDAGEQRNTVLWPLMLWGAFKIEENRCRLIYTGTQEHVWMIVAWTKSLLYQKYILVGKWQRKRSARKCTCGWGDNIEIGVGKIDSELDRIISRQDLMERILWWRVPQQGIYWPAE